MVFIRTIMFHYKVENYWVSSLFKSARIVLVSRSPVCKCVTVAAGEPEEQYFMLVKKVSVENGDSSSRDR